MESSIVLNPPISSNKDLVDDDSVLKKGLVNENGMKVGLIEINGKKVSRNSTGKRKYHQKSKSGCDNCKRRRVKCDETKPFCKKCGHMKLDCVYSPIKPRRKKNRNASGLKTESKLNIGNYENPISNIPTMKHDLEGNKQRLSSPKFAFESLPLQPQNSYNYLRQSMQGYQYLPQQKQTLLLPQLMTMSTSSSYSGQYSGPLHGPNSGQIGLKTGQDGVPFFEMQNKGSPPPLQSTGMSVTNSFSSVFSPNRVNSVGQQFQQPSTQGNIDYNAMFFDKNKRLSSVGMGTSLSQNLSVFSTYNIGPFQQPGNAPLQSELMEYSLSKGQHNGIPMKLNLTQEPMSSIQGRQQQFFDVDNKFMQTSKSELDRIKDVSKSPRSSSCNSSNSMGNGQVDSESVDSERIKTVPPAISNNIPANTDSSLMELSRTTANVTKPSVAGAISPAAYANGAPNGINSNTGQPLKPVSMSFSLSNTMPLMMVNNPSISTMIPSMLNSVNCNINMDGNNLRTSKWACLSQQSNLNIIDMKLFHHFCTTVSHTILNANITNTEFWTVRIVDLAFDNPFLLHAILALSASHMSRTEGEFESFIISHRNDSIKLLKCVMYQLNSENTDAAVSCVILLLFEALAFIKPNYSKQNSTQENVTATALAVNFKTLMDILSVIWVFAKNSIFASVMMTDITGITVDSQNNKALNLVCFDKAMSDLYPVEIGSHYLATLASLEQLYQHQNSPNFILKLLAFPSSLDKMFVSILSAGDAGASKIMQSYYSLLRKYITKNMNKHWFLEDAIKLLPENAEDYAAGNAHQMMQSFLSNETDTSYISMNNMNNMNNYL